MKAVLQRASRASVTVEGKKIGQIENGIVALVGFGEGDTSEGIDPLCEKILNLRIFPNEAGKFDRSVVQENGEILLISQFTLYGDCRKGRRPDFNSALAPEKARVLYELLVKTMKEKYPE
jgi:D-tyrosyl-tRNA(Tyr) deacylase